MVISESYGPVLLMVSYLLEARQVSIRRSSSFSCLAFAGREQNMLAFFSSLDVCAEITYGASESSFGVVALNLLLIKNVSWNHVWFVWCILYFLRQPKMRWL